MIIPVVKEVTVMVKRYEVVEEVRITKKLTETPMMQEITLRREHVDIERSNGNTQEQP
jgi:stress response protein YsnF